MDSQPNNFGCTSNNQYNHGSLSEHSVNQKNQDVNKKTILIRHNYLRTNQSSPVCNATINKGYNLRKNNVVNYLIKKVKREKYDLQPENSTILFRKDYLQWQRRVEFLITKSEYLID